MNWITKLFSKKEQAKQCDVEIAFIEIFDKAACIQHWHNTGKNDEGMVVSSESVYELWEVLNKYRDLRCSL